MARQLLQDSDAFRFLFQSGKLGASTQALTGNLTLTEDSPILHLVDPNGSNRTITLPAAQLGCFFLIGNSGSANSILVNNSVAALQTTLTAGQGALLASNGSTWMVLRAWADLGVFTDTVNGLVPYPGIVDSGRFLREDGTWAAAGVGASNAYSFITDGTDTATGSGADTFKIRSSDSTITIDVTDNDVTHGDNVNLTVNETNVDHDALLNFAANEHVDHTSVSISAGIGLTGGGTIAANRTLSLSVDGLSVIALATGDHLPFYDISGTTHGKVTISDLNAFLSHDSLAGYDANRHIDHTAVSISAGTGLTGGGTIAASRTLSLDINGLTAHAEGLAAGDLLVVYDASLAGHYKLSFSTLNTSLDHNVLTNYSANRHIDHTAVTITGTGNLTGGGDISASRTLEMANMAAGTVKGRAIGAGTGTPTDLTGAQQVESHYNGLSLAEKTSAGAYSMLSADDHILVNKTVGEATTVNLVTASGRKRPVKIVDLKGDAATNNITIDGATTETIVGLTTYLIRNNYGSVTLWPKPDGSGWYI